jgi:hypothetical protein
MAQRFDPITQGFQLSGLDSLFQQSPANLASSLLNSGMSPQEVSLQTGLSPDELMLLQRDQMTNVPEQPPMATMGMDQSGGIASTLGRGLMSSDPTGELGIVTSHMVDQMDMLGLTKDEDTADDLDTIVAAQINSAAEKVQTAEASGDPQQLAEAQKNANDITSLNTSIVSFLGNSPEERKEKMQIYKNAAASMLGGDDLEKYIRRPDEALPYMVAGMSLMQSGAEGEDWTTALTNAFSKYAVTKKQEDRQFDDKYLQFKLNERIRKDEFATNLALEDLKISAAQITEKGTPYIVNGGMRILNTMEATKLSRTEGVDIRPYDKDLDGKVSDYTITDPNGNSITTLLTNSEASGYQDMGFQIVSGNQNKDTKQYQIVYPEGFTGAPGSRLEGNPNFANLTDSQVENLRKKFPDVDFSDKDIDLIPILRNIDGKLMPMLVPETQVNYKTDQKQYAGGFTFSVDSEGNTTFISGPGGSERTLNKDRRNRTKEFREQATDIAEVYTLLDDIMKVVDQGAQLPGGARTFTNIMQRGLDEIGAIGRGFDNIVTATNDVLNFTDTTFKGADGSSITAQQLFTDFTNTEEYSGLLGTNVNNREYQALTFNLAVALAKAMGLGEARALSDRDLVHAMKSAGFDSSNRESLVARHNQLRKQLLRSLYQTKFGLESDVYLTGDDKFVEGLNAILQNPIDPFNPDVSFASLYKDIESETDDTSQTTTQQSQTSTGQPNYSTRYTPFFSSLGREDNFSAILERISKKANEVSNESSSVRQMFVKDITNYILTLPQDQKFLIADEIQKIMEGTE